MSQTAGRVAPQGAPAVAGASRRRILTVVVLVVLLAAFSLLSIVLGSRVVGLEGIARGVSAAFGGEIADGFDAAAVQKRVPRTALALVAGAALGVSGAVMQGVTRNPLADPGILGVNMGASLAIVVGMAWFGLSSAAGHVWVAIVGAAVTALLVYAIASLGGGATPLKLALAGAAASAALASFISAVVLPRTDIAGNVRDWQIGGVGGGSWAQLGLVLPFLIAGFAICLFSARSLNLLALGDDLAAGLGQRVAIARAAGALGAVVLCGSVTAVTGPIGFVGLVVPHACRLLAGVDHRWLLPLSAAAGAILLTVADIAGRVVAPPAEIAVGIITSFIGAPVFIWIVRRRKVREL